MSSVSFISFASGAEPTAPLNTPELKQVVGKDKKNTIIFFQNPLGRPCIEQKAILDKLHAEKKSSFNIAHVSTMKPEDRQAFYDYGVRSLPMLVLVNKNGKISRVFSPGIQSASTIAGALSGAE
ncbi:MAG: hypothetical protein A2X94_00950 [Bdellovibrionales bacterium GWB1_55_8]|nr:MAG: hypothetical protein A2X94_00950 [Bdellovibrionales bacterium GWB1_55_8]